MNPQFEWQASDDDGHWETIARTTGRTRHVRRRRVRWWRWMAIVAAIATAATCGYLIVRHRYDQASRQITFQIQSVIDLEARAFAQGDWDLFLAQQDQESLFWPASQARWFRTRRGRSLTSPLAVLSAKVENVNLRGDVAWVQVIEGDPPVRRMRFYRQTDQGWLHTAPDLEFWRDPVERYYGEQLILRYHQRDQPYIDPLMEQLAQAFYEICATVGCGEESRFEVLFYPAHPGGDTQADLILPSPWLSGIPVEGDWSGQYGEPAVRALTQVVSVEESRQARFWGRIATQERWLGLSPVTSEAAYLSLLLVGRRRGLGSRLDTPSRSPQTSPDD